MNKNIWEKVFADAVRSSISAVKAFKSENGLESEVPPFVVVVAYDEKDNDIVAIQKVLKFDKDEWSPYIESLIEDGVTKGYKPYAFLLVSEAFQITIAEEEMKKRLESGASISPTASPDRVEVTNFMLFTKDYGSFGSVRLGDKIDTDEIESSMRDLLEKSMNEDGCQIDHRIVKEARLALKEIPDVG